MYEMYLSAVLWHFAISVSVDMYGMHYSLFSRKIYLSIFLIILCISPIIFICEAYGWNNTYMRRIYCRLIKNNHSDSYIAIDKWGRCLWPPLLFSRSVKPFHSERAAVISSINRKDMISALIWATISCWLCLVDEDVSWNVIKWN